MISGKIVLSNNLTNPPYAQKANFLVVLQKDQKFKIIHKSKIKPNEYNRLLGVFFECEKRYPIGLKLQPKYFALVEFLMQHKNIGVSINEEYLQHDFLAIENFTIHSSVLRRLKDLENKWKDYYLFQRNKPEQDRILSPIEESNTIHYSKKQVNSTTVYIPDNVPDIVLDIDLLLNSIGFSNALNKLEPLMCSYKKEILLYAEINQKRLNLNKHGWEQVLKWFENI